MLKFAAVNGKTGGGVYDRINGAKAYALGIAVWNKKDILRLHWDVGSFAGHQLFDVDGDFCAAGATGDGSKDFRLVARSGFD